MTALLHLPYELILGSQSPRRRHLLAELGYRFSTRGVDWEESYPPQLQDGDIAAYLAEAKARHLQPDLQPQERVLTADTVVWCEGQSVAKAAHLEEAREMLHFLSGRCHRVTTAMAFASAENLVVERDHTDVYFQKLTTEAIDYYLSQFKPLDKAGAYGIQEWIGLWGIRRMEGSFYTVMGLPTHLVPALLRSF